MGEMKRAIAREEKDRRVQMEPERMSSNRFASTLVIAAAIIAAVRLARDDISTQTPRLVSAMPRHLRTIYRVFTYRARREPCSAKPHHRTVS
jgi:hypothetical protein